MKILIATLSLLMAGQTFAGTIAPGLEAELEQMDPFETTRVLVILDEQPDVAGLDKALAANRRSRAERHREVVGTLQQTAAATQQSLLAALGRDKAAGGIVGYVPHWIINAVVVTGTAEAIRDLAARPDVRTIEPDLQVELIEPVMTKIAGTPDQGVQGFVTPGIQAIGADRVWRELGITGAGTLVANLDSGVDGAHPALAGRWQGRFADASSAWLDAAGVGSPTIPVDNVGHGTHVMGTITGATAQDTIGVAPGARWIAANPIYGMVENLDNQIIAAFEWLADPDGDPATSDDVPDVCHNSWGVSPGTGHPACYSLWWQVIDNCEAAGVVVTFSAGNEGPYAGTIRSPGDRAASPTNGFTIGSTGSNVPFTASTFSSRGPSLCGGEFAMKPEVMAPGENIYSAFPGGQYAYMDGTSMAGPHVAGVVALMREAAPDLDVHTIKEILMATAVDQGVPGEDNTYGHGFVDAYAAVAAVIGNVSRVSGRVTDADTGDPLAGVVIRDLRGAATATTAADGTYAFTILAGAAPLRLRSFGYATTEIVADLVGGSPSLQDVALPPLPAAAVTGRVTGPGGAPVPGAVVTALGTPVPAVTTDATGAYALDLPAGADEAYELMATAEGLAYEIRKLGLQGDRTADFALTAPRFDGFETADFATLPWQRSGAVLFGIDPGEAAEGVHSARSGAITHGQSTSLDLDWYCSTRDTLTFQVKVESEPGFDVLRFVLDGVERGTWSGTVDWTEVAIELAPGPHAMTWEYSKDSSASIGRDAAWVDLVTLPGTGVRPFPAVTLDRNLFVINVDAAATATSELELGNGGEATLAYLASVRQAGGGVPAWLAVAPDSGVVHPTSARTLTVTAAPGYLGAGAHQAELVLATNDPDHPDTTVAVVMIVNAVADVPEDAPRAVALRGAVPNPFNPRTDIHFSLPRRGPVSIAVYDVAGRRVRTLVDGELPAGHHHATWEGRDDEGRSAASGIYYARLVAAGETRIKPMALVR